jgi:iron-sulfur cluster repair protein YtfE (RIC family)
MFRANLLFANKVAGLASRAVAAASETASMAKFTVLGKTGNLDAVDLLTGQHKEALLQLDETKHATDAVSRRKLAERLCNNIECHMRIEEELFYPAIVQLPAFDKKYKEHQLDAHVDVKQAMKKLLATEDATSDEFSKVLREFESNLLEHMTEEEKVMFPTVKTEMPESERMDLGEKLRKRFTELHSEHDPERMVKEDLQQG